jgi:hypothetical protein
MGFSMGVPHFDVPRPLNPAVAEPLEGTFPPQIGFGMGIPVSMFARSAQIAPRHLNPAVAEPLKRAFVSN